MGSVQKLDSSWYSWRLTFGLTRLAELLVTDEDLGKVVHILPIKHTDLSLNESILVERSTGTTP